MIANATDPFKLRFTDLQSAEAKAAELGREWVALPATNRAERKLGLFQLGRNLGYAI